MSSSTPKTFLGKIPGNNRTTTYLAFAAFSLSALSIPMLGAAFAQPSQTTTMLVRVLQGTTQTGLVNVSVNVGSVTLSQLVNVQGNNIAVPITIPVSANIGLGAQVCATVLSSGSQVCNAVTNINQAAANEVPIHLNQAQ